MRLAVYLPCDLDAVVNIWSSLKHCGWITQEGFFHVCMKPTCFLVYLVGWFQRGTVSSLHFLVFEP